MKAQTIPGIEPVLTFRVGPRFLGISISKILEILPTPKPTPVPLAFAHVEGIVEYRKALIPVYNLGRRLSVPPNPSASSHLIVIRDGDASFGVTVDEIGKIISQPTPADLPAGRPVQGLPPGLLQFAAADGENIVPVILPQALLTARDPIRMEA